jgi:hypothetical protein
MDDFAGFDDDALRTLRALPGWTKQDRAADKDAYDHLVETTKLFALAVGDRIRETVSDTVTVDPRINGSISPFNRDLRFVEDRSRPYKDHLMVNFWDGADKKASPHAAGQGHTDRHRVRGRHGVHQDRPGPVAGGCGRGGWRGSDRRAH